MACRVFLVVDYGTEGHALIECDSERDAYERMKLNPNETMVVKEIAPFTWTENVGRDGE